MIIGDVWTFDDFNSHAHVERDTLRKYPHSVDTDFNSHAHVERDLISLDCHLEICVISTHTLTWSVTCNNGTCGKC